MRLKYLKKNSAYTLIELSLVLAIAALMIAGIMQLVTQNTRRDAAAEVKDKMDAIEAALLDFRRLNNRLPCPADGTQAITSQYFGVEGVVTSNSPSPTCIHGNTYTNDSDMPNSPTAPDASFYDGQNTVAGDVPVRTLGLPDDDMFDPWGGRFFYSVDMRLAANNAPFITYGVTSTTIGSMTVNDENGNPKTTNAVAIVMSYGPDGHGAFQLSGARKAIGNTNSFTQTNCHCDQNAAATAWPNPPVFIQAPATSVNATDPSGFDDIVRFYLRSSFLNNTDMSVTR